MVRIMKVVKDYGSVTVGTASATLETQQIKALGDLFSWSLYIKYTTVLGTGTLDADGGTPAGAWKGSSSARFFSRISFKDKNNTDLFVAQRNDIFIMGYLLSLVDINEFIQARGRTSEPATDTAAATNQEHEYIVPQSVMFADLPGTFELEIGTLDDYYNAVGTGTATINELALTVRYAPADNEGFTIRSKAFNNASSFSSDTDLASQLPDNLNILKLAYIPSNVNALSAPADLVNTRVDRLSFRRGANEEIENFRRFQLDRQVDTIYPIGNFQQSVTGASLSRPKGMTVIPTDNFVKTPSSLFFFKVNAQITPRVYYLYT